ncbi:MAG: hypothetical protein A4E62_00132 [Syntrophorhabdus sp. PtaU1.Bin002]|nr:MAG: hypothetical protein A4E62_00132 [Syntrophorhabdus sp. PtaU1.Bin002]
MGVNVGGFKWGGGVSVGWGDKIFVGVLVMDLAAVLKVISNTRYYGAIANDNATSLRG